mmetsp:Transcript_2918/g.5567  ORF Transcript_2918/g.5567 Transcript_2918/m.5567 type:complete len:104 (+) Transcript_2918:156-467(+)
MPEEHGRATTKRMEELFCLGFTIEHIKELPRFAHVGTTTLRRWLENFKWNGSMQTLKRKRKRGEYESGDLSPALGKFVLCLLIDDPCLHLREIRDDVEWTGVA